jgi:hypothetical protein
MNPSKESNNIHKFDVPSTANNERKYLPLTTTSQHNNQKIGHSRFTVIPDPTSLQLSGFTRPPVFDREHPAMPNFGQPPPPLSAPPEGIPKMYSNLLTKQTSVEIQHQKATSDVNKPLTYANVLMAPQKTAKEKEMEAAMSDPIIRIRSLGTQANQDDQGMSGGALGGFGLGGSSRHSNTGNNESISRQEGNQHSAAWFNTFDKRW